MSKLYIGEIIPSGDHVKVEGNFVLQNLTADPTTFSPVKGQIYFNTVDNIIRHFDGTQWVNTSSTTTTGGGGSTVTSDGNVDGGTPSTIYSVTQNIDGGGP